MKDKYSAAKTSRCWTCSNEISHVVATGFFWFRDLASSSKSWLRTSKIFSSVSSQRDKYSCSEMSFSLIYAAA